MSIQAVSWALELDVPDAAAKLVLVSLANHADHKSGECFPTIEMLSKEASQSERSVQRKIAQLVKWGLVEREVDFTCGRQRANQYRIVVSRTAILDVEEGCQSDTPSGVTLLSPRGDTAVTGEGVTAVTPGGDTAVTPTKEPSEKPSETTITAREALPHAASSGGDDEAKIDWADFTEAYRPRSPNDEIGKSKKAWNELGSEDRAAAVAYAPSYCREASRGSREPMYSSSYLHAKPWRRTGSAPVGGVTIEWVPEGSPRWQQLVAGGKSESLMRSMLHKHEGRDCFPNYTSPATQEVGR